MNWQNFFSGDNSKTNWFYVVGFALAMPFAFLAFAIIVWHVWIAKKPMDGEMVRLLLGVLGIASGGAGLSAFSKTTWSQTLIDGAGQIYKKGPRPRE